MRNRIEISVSEIESYMIQSAFDALVEETRPSEAPMAEFEQVVVHKSAVPFRGVWGFVQEMAFEVAVVAAGLTGVGFALARVLGF